MFQWLFKAENILTQTMYSKRHKLIFNIKLKPRLLDCMVTIGFVHVLWSTLSPKLIKDAKFLMEWEYTSSPRNTNSEYGCSHTHSSAFPHFPAFFTSTQLPAAQSEWLILDLPSNIPSDAALSDLRMSIPCCSTFQAFRAVLSTHPKSGVFSLL